ncbi:hypothetical protein EDD64_12929 [Effusibacillus lacus]|nr:hypothetical protein EDD64_12929 [Effusibacillus lacus]
MKKKITSTAYIVMYPLQASFLRVFAFEMLGELGCQE